MLAIFCPDMLILGQQAKSGEDLVVKTVEKLQKAEAHASDRKKAGELSALFSAMKDTL